LSPEFPPARRWALLPEATEAAPPAAGTSFLIRDQLTTQVQNIGDGGTLIEGGGKTYLGIREDAQTVVERLNVTPPFVQLTTRGGTPVWVKSSAVIMVINIDKEGTTVRLEGGGGLLKSGPFSSL
jgi:hypothetical protein